MNLLCISFLFWYILLVKKTTMMHIKVLTCYFITDQQKVIFLFFFVFEFSECHIMNRITLTIGKLLLKNRTHNCACNMMQ